ncbi:choline/ethanolamine kinase [Puia dinghuensis]|uniref:Choline/ethanolamine kinase n=1 Tax=Puia dinghuensis TaxID=1792502 RepID=A0A8J2XT32_9BACT|nr:choline/ethanolamine kinase [Puia dinghuensis]
MERALLNTFGTTALSTIDILAGGLSGATTYKIALNGKDYLLKLEPSAPGITAAGKGLTCGEIATRAGVAPPIYYLDPAEGVTISGFIATRPLREVFDSPQKLLGELARTIRSIHAMPLLPKQNNMVAIADGIFKQLAASRTIGADLYAEVADCYAAIREGFPMGGSDMVPSHNDLNPNNLLCDGTRIWVIDWDAAFQNDRYVDLAIAANFFVADEEQARFFLEAYFESAVGDYKIAQLFIMRQLCYLIYGALILMRTGEGKLALASAEEQAAYGRGLLQEGINNIRSPRFQRSLYFVWS